MKPLKVLSKKYLISPDRNSVFCYSNLSNDSVQITKYIWVEHEMNSCWQVKSHGYSATGFARHDYHATKTVLGWATIKSEDFNKIERQRRIEKGEIR